jgi:parallel beta-helix repeat protein
VENSQQRGIIVHGTHRSLVDNNVLYNIRGSGIYIEDGNEMLNRISYNIYVCNFPYMHPIFHGCTVPGTSNRIADTSDNQSGIFSRAASNDLVGNRSANGFNGMLLSASGIGRGSSYGKVCETDSKIGRIEGNTFHSNGRFG